MKGLKKWYSFSENGSYDGSDPNFFNIKEKKWASFLELSYPIILKEFESVIAAKDKNIIPYYNQTLASKAENWMIFPLYVWGKKQKENCGKCSETSKLIESISGMTSCSFSVLKANTSIKPHYGDSNVMYRCHLTLKCNHTLPDIGMRVRETSISWKLGEIFAFCDAYEHEVWNNTNEDRWVLIIDILREEFESQKKEICTEVNATLFWQLKFQKSNLINHIPKWGRKLLLKTTALFMGS